MGAQTTSRASDDHRFPRNYLRSSLDRLQRHPHGASHQGCTHRVQSNGDFNKTVLGKCHEFGKPTVAAMTDA